MAKKRKKRIKSERKLKIGSDYRIAVHYDRMIKHHDKKRYAEAISEAEKLLQITPRRSDERYDAYSVGGGSLMMLRQYEEAYQFMKRAVKEFPEDSALRLNLAGAAIFTSRSGVALRELKAAAQLEPKGTRVRKIIDEKLREIEPLVLEEIAERGADFTLEMLIKQQERYNQGLKHMTKQRWKEAEKAFRDVIALGDVLPQPWNNLGTSLLMQGRSDEARKAFQRALELDPDYDIARQNLSLAEKSNEGSHLVLKMTQPFADAKISILREEPALTVVR